MNSRHFGVLSRMRQPFFAGFHALNFDSRELMKPIGTNLHIQHRQTVVFVFFFAQTFFFFVYFGSHTFEFFFSFLYILSCTLWYSVFYSVHFAAVK